MKRTLLYSLPSCLLLASPAQAQLGLRVGGNLTRLATTAKFPGEDVVAERQLGYQAGLYCQLPLEGRLSLVPEVQLTQERQQVAISAVNLINSFGSPYTSDLRQCFMYMQVPVMVRLTWSRLYVEAGPQGSYLLGGREQGKQLYNDPYAYSGYYILVSPTPIDRPVTERYQRWDAGVGLGAGLNLAAGFGLNIRAYQGFISPTQAQHADPYAYQGRQLRQGVQASLTYHLPPHQ